MRTVAIHLFALATVRGFPLSHDEDRQPRSFNSESLQIDPILARDANPVDSANTQVPRDHYIFLRGEIVSQSATIFRKPQRNPLQEGDGRGASDVGSTKQNRLLVRSPSIKQLLKRNSAGELVIRDLKPAPPPPPPPKAPPPAPPPGGDECDGKHGIKHSICETGRHAKNFGNDIKKGVTKVYNDVIKPAAKWVAKNAKEIAINVGTAVAGAVIEAATLGAATPAVAALEIGVNAGTKIATVAKVAKTADDAAKLASKAKDVAKGVGNQVKNKVEDQAKDQVKQQFQQPQPNNQNQNPKPNRRAVFTTSHQFSS